MTCYERSDFLALDHTTLRHLEILERYIGTRRGRRRCWA